MTSIPKAVLYYSPVSVWSAVARLTIEEKGYGKDEIEYRIVDLSKGENYDPTFLRLNPKATVPTLLVPYEDTLSGDGDSRYKALTDTKAIVEFLDKSRSAISRTHTTSSAPAPTLTPATIAATTVCKVIIDEILHSEIANPNTLLFANARDEASLQVLAADRLASLKQRQQAWAGYISEAESGQVRVSDKVKKLWMEKLEATTVIIAVLADAGKAQTELDDSGQANRAAFFKTARRAWEVNLTEVLTQLSKEMVGPYTLGDQFSIADLHLAGWLTRVVKLAGGTSAEDGQTIAKKLEGYIGGGFRIARDFTTEQARREKAQVDEQTKIGAFWDAVRERGSWRTVYSSGLY